MNTTFENFEIVLCWFLVILVVALIIYGNMKMGNDPIYTMDVDQRNFLKDSYPAHGVEPGGEIPNR